MYSFFYADLRYFFIIAENQYTANILTNKIFIFNKIFS